jgi:acetyltransferase-like isoleucine patch superfamily enzyme
VKFPFFRSSRGPATRRGESLRIRDPLAINDDQRAVLDQALSTATNSLGRDVIVGDSVTLWGGKNQRCVGIHLGDRVRLYDGCALVLDELTAESGIRLANDVAINFYGYIDGSGGVSVGPGTVIGPHVSIVSSAHRLDQPFRTGGKTFASVSIGADVWIGANAVILPGVTIADGAVVGAGAVVTKPVDARTIVVGNPAVFLRRRDA